jgi:hypothetical protein
MLRLKSRSKAWDRHRVAGHLILKATCEHRPHSSLTSRNPGLLLAMGRALAAAMAAASASRGRATMMTAFGGVAGVGCCHCDLDCGGAHRDIDDDGIVIEIDFMAAAVSAA